MRHKFIFVLALLLILLPQALFAKQKSFTYKEKQWILHQNIENQFTVIAGKVVITPPNNKAKCQSDNNFILAALKSRQVIINQANYEICVKKSVTSFHKKDSNNPLIIYEYWIEPKSGNANTSLTRFMGHLKANQYKSGLVSGIEMPITCYYLTVRNQLVLLSHYGFLESYENFNWNRLVKQLIAL